jgi:hypothetical protein
MTDKRLEQLNGEWLAAVQQVAYFGPRVLAAREALAKLEEEMGAAEDAEARAHRAVQAYTAPGAKLREVA